MNMQDHQTDAENQPREFICGVVEGFYGKPWSFDQRKDLFKQLKDLKLNSFMYAPKDDLKHRAKWRQLYSETEASALRDLIQEAKSHNIEFYYSLAPGLDMVYSDPGEMETMKQKFDQLVALGCESFAILFDDIEPIMNERDAKVFKNYASAQVCVTNGIFEHLKRPKFLFCPTEYCESRAVPNVTDSIYLNTIGSGLERDIDFMWSGCRVISRFITEESIERLTNVIRRPPVIWENLHANDYDKKRVFLGPYSGRSTQIIPKLRGVLTNPNCEYEANYIAIHTLAQWSRCTEDVNLHNRCQLTGSGVGGGKSKINAAKTGDVLENDTSVGKDKSSNNNTNNNDNGLDGNATKINESVYDPSRALRRAIQDWLPKVLESKSLPVGSVSLEAQTDIRTDQAAGAQLAKESETEMTDSQMLVVSEDNRSASDDSNNSSSKRMDLGDADSAEPVELASPKAIVDTNSCDSCEMQETSGCVPSPLPSQPPASESLFSSLPTNTTTSVGGKIGPQVDADSLSLLAELFFLPFEHGSRGSALLNDIKWLTDNSDVLVRQNALKSGPNLNHAVGGSSDMVAVSGQEESPMEDDGLTNELNEASSLTNITDTDKILVANWLEKAENLNLFCSHISQLIDSIINNCPNKLLASELYPYLAEMRDLIVIITDYIKFLRFRSSHSDCFYSQAGGCQVMAKQKHQKDQSTVTLSLDEQEPWVHRGGLIGDVHRLIF